VVTISMLWGPILLATVLVFFASFLVWTVLPIHRNDYKPLPDEASVADALRKQDVRPGQYLLPCVGGRRRMKDPDFLRRMQEGPVAFITVIPSGPPRMGKNLTQWFVYLLVISVFVAYLAHRTLAPGTDYLQVFRVTGTAAILAYAGAVVHQGIWGGKPWGNVSRDILDGVIYALLTAAAFSWLWPG
jgi:hypothetical protein